MQVNATDIFAPPILAVIFLLLGWGAGRVMTAGPLTPEFKRTLLYTSTFVLGMGYSMAVVAVLEWPKPIFLVLTISWGGLLALHARRTLGAEAKEGEEAKAAAGGEMPASVAARHQSRVRERLAENLCPLCGGKNVDRVPPSGIVEKFREMRGYHSYHCLRCYGRFYRREAPKTVGTAH